MVICEIMAGGTGTRMGGAAPKQFMKINDKPIIIRTLEAFIKSDMIDAFVICAPKEHMGETNAIIKEYLCEAENIFIVSGGNDRNHSVYNGCKFAKAILSAGDGDIIITHDAVRPFINDRIIEENINKAKEYGAATTVLPCVDTVMMSKDGAFIDGMLNRKALVRIQTPQTFSFSLLFETFCLLSAEEIKMYTDTAGLILSRGAKVALVNGEDYNIKITTPFDIALAKSICDNFYPV